MEGSIRPLLLETREWIKEHNRRGEGKIEESEEMVDSKRTWLTEPTKQTWVHGDCNSKHMVRKRLC